MISQEALLKEISGEQKRYSDSTLIITLFSELLKSSPGLGEVIFIEKELKKLNVELKQELLSKTRAEIISNFKEKIKGLPKIEVDLILKNDSYEALEFKTSVSSHPDEIKNTITQIIERDSDLLEDLNILEIRNIIFLCHKDDSQKILGEFTRKKIGMKMNRKVSFLEWLHAENKDGDVCIYIEFKFGDKKISKLVEHISKDKIISPVNSLAILRQSKKFIFTGKKPPKPYLLSAFKRFLFSHIYPILNKANTPDECLLPETLEDLRERFIEKHKNIFCTPHKKWFNECIEFFKMLKILKVSNGGVTVNIKNLTKKRRSHKDEDELFPYLCAKERIKQMKSKLRFRQKKEKRALQKQKELHTLPLDSFFKKS